MRRCLLILCLIWLAAAIPVCGQGRNARFKIIQKGRVGYIDVSGRVVIPCQFEEGWEFYGGLAAVMRDGLWGFVDEQGTIVVKPAYDDIQCFSERAGPFKNGLAPIVDYSAPGYIDFTGKQVWPLP